VENSPPSKCAATVRCDNGQLPIRAGMGVDGEWERHRVYQVARGCESVRACRFRPAGYCNCRLQSLRQFEDVAQGLIYIHGQAIVHGDLKGV